MRFAAAIVLAVIIALPAQAQPLMDAGGGLSRDPHLGYFVGKEDRLEIAINIWGEVMRPGIYRVPDDTDLVGLISVAGGPTQNANLKGVRLTRSNGSERLVQVDLVRWLETHPSTGLPPLRPGDTVRVPRNASRTWGDGLRTLSTIAVIASTYVYISDRLH